jgi:hypothetical protein
MLLSRRGVAKTGRVQLPVFSLAKACLTVARSLFSPPFESVVFVVRWAASWDPGVAGHDRTGSDDGRGANRSHPEENVSKQRRCGGQCARLSARVRMRLPVGRRRVGHETGEPGEHATLPRGSIDVRDRRASRRGGTFGKVSVDASGFSGCSVFRAPVFGLPELPWETLRREKRYSETSHGVFGPNPENLFLRGGLCGEDPQNRKSCVDCRHHTPPRRCRKGPFAAVPDLSMRLSDHRGLGVRTSARTGGYRKRFAPFPAFGFGPASELQCR